MTIEQSIDRLAAAMEKIAERLDRLPSEATKQETKTPETKTPETKTPETKTPEVKSPPKETQSSGTTKVSKSENVPAQSEAPPATGESAPTDGMTYDEVKQVTNLLAKTHGGPKVKELLGVFGVDHATKLPEEKWPLYVAACRAALPESE